MDRILWVVNGSPLHELGLCNERRWELPSRVLSGMPKQLLKNVVWQPGGAGFLMPKSACSNETIADIADVERRWLKHHRVVQYDYFSLALHYAPFMADARHFTYYFFKCNDTFPELAHLAARLALQAGIRRPLPVCPMVPLRRDSS